MSTINLVFPHQLFEKSPLLNQEGDFYIIEEHLFFTQYKFHKQKIAFHRATMKFYETHLKSLDKTVHYISATETDHDIRNFCKALKGQNISKINFIDPTDTWLSKRLHESAQAEKFILEEFKSPLFINGKNENSDFFRTDKKKFFQTKFYTDQRKKRNILIDSAGAPVGGKWTYDVDNRKKYPAKKMPPSVRFPDLTDFWKEAFDYTETNFSRNYGEVSKSQYYPVNYQQSKDWLEQFFETRFHEFGPYEDAIVSHEGILNHSVLTPMLNVGLLLPDDIINHAISYALKNDVPINSLEGFVRQILGWREFIRGVYEAVGSKERTTNFWGFSRKIPASFYDGTTGIPPIDITIKKVLKTGYSHHIERLMVLGNFMVLCEFDPDEVYKWFMELFIDAYDWVMVTNVYGMSQFADGGLMATKPYISGSNYLMKMSNYKKGPWQQTWDGLFWRFMHVNRDFFLKNPRLGMLVRTYDKMSDEKRNNHLENAEKYLESL